MTDPESHPAKPLAEPDDRFPSGPWAGFFLWPAVPGRHAMELRLTFREGVMSGEGRDRCGEFLVRGRYQTKDGKCWWTKKYLGKHDVFYEGFNEGRGIWGNWEIPRDSRGGFHIWPEAMGDPTLKKLEAEADVPVPVPEPEAVPELVTAGAGGNEGEPALP